MGLLVDSLLSLMPVFSLWCAFWRVGGARWFITLVWGWCLQGCIPTGDVLDHFSGDWVAGGFTVYHSVVGFLYGEVGGG